jgi:uncharacterized damage-inducible protein DinB
MADEWGVAAVALGSMRSRIASVLPSQIRSCLERLTDEQIWWRPNDSSNSIGNLVLHLCGSIRHYLCRSIGGVDFTRDRPAEFAERGPLSRDELLSILDATISEAAETLDRFDPERLLDPTEEPGYYPSRLDQIFGVAIHIATHMGQIVYVTKMLEEGSLDELWINAHRKPAS